MILLLLLAGPAQAQVNIENQRALDTDGAAFSVGVDMSLLAGNKELLDVGASGRFDYRAGRHYAFLLGTARYGETEGTVYHNRLFGHLRYNYDLRPWLVAEVFGQGERDTITRLRLRVLGGGGLRVRYFRQRERVGLYQGSALMAEYETLNLGPAGRHPDEVRTVRWSNYLHLRLELNTNTYFTRTTYLQSRLDAFGDTRLLDETTLAFALSQYLSFRTTAHVRYDSRPPDGVERFDVAIRNGLTLTF